MQVLVDVEAVKRARGSERGESEWVVMSQARIDHRGASPTPGDGPHRPSTRQVCGEGLAVKAALPGRCSHAGVKPSLVEAGASNPCRSPELSQAKPVTTSRA
jgi:hypothetical protein